MKIICPHCGSELESTQDLSDTTISCPACHQPFTVPADVPPANPPGSPLAAPPVGAAAPGAPASLHHPLRWVLSGIVLLLLAGAAVFFLHRPRTVAAASAAAAATEAPPMNASSPGHSCAARSGSDSSPAAPPAAIPAVQPSPDEDEATEAAASQQPIIQKEVALYKAQMYHQHGLDDDAKRLLIEFVNDRGSERKKAIALQMLGMIELDENHIAVALSTWRDLVQKYPNTPEARLIQDKIKTLSQVVGDLGKENSDDAVAQTYLHNARFWSRGSDTIFHIDSSWISDLDAALKWYDCVIQQFPGTSSARIAYEEKMHCLLGWKESGEYGESYGVRANFNLYMPQLIQALNSYRQAFPDSPQIPAFEFQIAQQFWARNNFPLATQWLKPLLKLPDDSFYKDLAVRRMNALRH